MRLHCVRIVWKMSKKKWTNTRLVYKSMTIIFITQPPIYGVIVYFCYVMSQWTIAWATVLDIDWDYIMAWFPALLLITQRRSSTFATKIRIGFVYARRCYVAMADIRHGLAPCNTHNLVIYVQKHKVWVLVVLVRTRGTLWHQIWAD